MEEDRDQLIHSSPEVDGRDEQSIEEAYHLYETLTIGQRVFVWDPAWKER